MRKFGKESTAPADTGGSREKSDNGWLKNHWCALSICLIVVVAFLLRTVFAYGVSADGNFALSGGSSAQYHLHVIESILNGSYSLTDTAVNYPIGGLNVYPPLMDFVAAIVAMVLSAVGFSTTEAASAALAGLNPVVGALTCIPVYLVGKELFGNKVIGVVSALIFAFLALPIATSVFSSGTEYALAAFLTAFMSLFLIRMVHAIDAEEVSRKAVFTNAVLAGLFLALAALTWNGFRVLLVVVIVAMVLQILVDRFKGRDFSTVLTAYSAVLLIGVVVSAPYYIAAGLWDAVFSGPLLITVVAIVFAFAFKALESKPWIFTIPALVVVFLVLLAVLYFAAPDLFTAFVSGNSIYSSSIMESLVSTRVSMSNVSSYYGWLTMWLPICLGLYEVYVFAKGDRSATQLLKVVWLLGLFFIVWTSYANAAVVGVVFAVGSAAVIVKVLDLADLRSWFNTMKVAGFPGCFRKMLKPFPLASVLIVALLVVVPNLSAAVDAGSSDGYQYTIRAGDSYPVGDLWDSYEDAPKSGALVTWIDYAYDSVAQGGFTSVTDGIGGGASDAANIYLADGASGAVAGMALRLMMAEDTIPASVPADVRAYIEDPSKAVSEIVSNPSVYGKVRADISDVNAVYLASINYMLENMSGIEIMELYDSVRSATQDDITYVLVDGSMLPLQYNDGSDFPTIAYFADYKTDGYGAATQFFSYNTYYGTTVYTDAIYDTFLWKAMIGTDAESAGFTSSYNYLAALAVSDGKTVAKPGSYLTGFDIVYWQVQYNENGAASVSSDGWEYMDYSDAIEAQRTQGGVINYLSSIILYEYVGTGSSVSTMTVTSADGATVDGARVVVNAEGSDVRENYSEAYTIAGKAQVMVPSGDYTVTLYLGDIEYASYRNQVPATVSVAAASLDLDVVVGGAPVTGADFKVVLENVDNGGTYEVETTDGSATIQTMVPGTYTYRLLDATGAASATGEVDVAPGSNTGFEIAPKTYNITATLKDVLGNTVDGSVVVVGTENGMTFTGDATDGKAVIAVLPGKYNAYATGDYVSMNTTDLNATSGNKSVTLNVFEADNVSTSLPSGVMVSSGAFSTVVTDGSFSVPVGYATDLQLYSVYGVVDGEVHMGTYDDGKGVTVTSGNAVSVTGTLKDGEKAVSGTVQFINGKTKTVVTVKAGSDGKFSADLVAGDYTILANNGSKVALVDKTVGGDVGDIVLGDGKKVSTTFRFDAQMSGATNLKLNSVLAQVDFTTGGKAYTVYAMTGTDGTASFYVPKDATGKLLLNGGALDNAIFDCKKLEKELSESGTTTYTLTVKVGEAGADKNVLKDVSVKSDYAMTATLYDDDEVKYTFTAGQTQTIQPGQYDIVIDGASGVYFDGTAYVYPGTNVFSGLDPVDVYTVTIQKNSGDVVTISGDGEHYLVDGKYYFEDGFEYFLKSVNGNGSEQKIAYGYISDETIADTTVDLRAQDARMTVTGSTGVDGDGKLTVTYGSDKVVFDIENGSYTVVLPSSVTAANFEATVTATVDGDEIEYTNAVDVTGLKDKEIRNVAVLTLGEVVSDEDEPFTADASSAQFGAGVGEVDVTITNNGDSEKTFMISAGDAWVLDKVYSASVAAGKTATVTVTGYYNAATVGLGSDGMTVTVTDINGSDSVECDIVGFDSGSTSNGAQILFAKDGGIASKDRVSASEYMYAITVVNSDDFSKLVEVDVNAVSGWFVTIMDEDGCTIVEPGTALEVFAFQTTTVYVKLMPMTGSVAGETPSVSGSVSVGSDSKQFNLSPEKVDLAVDSMEAEGTDISNEAPSVPTGVWILLAFGILMLIAVFWLGSKRGVFSRRN